MELDLFRQLLVTTLAFTFLKLSYHFCLLGVHMEISAFLVADWALPLPNFLNIHKAQKCFQIKALAVDALPAPGWDVYQIPGKRVH